MKEKAMDCEGNTMNIDNLLFPVLVNRRVFYTRFLFWKVFKYLLQFMQSLSMSMNIEYLCCALSMNIEYLAALD